VAPVVDIFDQVLGGEGRFRARPFGTIVSCPIVSPLTFGATQSDIVMAGVRAGVPIIGAPAPQSGATSPAALAGTLVQTVAEGLAILALVNFTVPGHPVAIVLLPFVSDLRSGAFTGGGGEEAVLMAAAGQIGAFYDLPTGVSAGMTDSKLPDAQAGHEKGVTVTAAALAGANLVGHSSGMLSTIMGCSYEAMVIDNDMLGNVQRLLRGIEVTEETLSFEAIRQVATGPGHYLGHEQTFALMESEYLYPKVSDRASANEWEEAGGSDAMERAHERARALLSTHYPVYIEPKTDAALRERYPIRLPSAAMRADCGRWTPVGSSGAKRRAAI
jgi:trimethylamine--corrinoid protein Co-methyltransferase